jgi:hypothetical protein
MPFNPTVGGRDRRKKNEEKIAKKAEADLNAMLDADIGAESEMGKMVASEDYLRKAFQKELDKQIARTTKRLITRCEELKLPYAMQNAKSQDIVVQWPEDLDAWSRAHPKRFQELSALEEMQNKLRTIQQQSKAKNPPSMDKTLGDTLKVVEKAQIQTKGISAYDSWFDEFIALIDRIKAKLSTYDFAKEVENSTDRYVDALNTRAKNAEKAKHDALTLQYKATTKTDPKLKDRASPASPTPQDQAPGTPSTTPKARK